MLGDLAVAFIVIASVALLVYRVPLGGCGAASALDEFAPR